MSDALALSHGRGAAPPRRLAASSPGGVGPWKQYFWTSSAGPSTLTTWKASPPASPRITDVTSRCIRPGASPDGIRSGPTGHPSPRAGPTFTAPPLHPARSFTGRDQVRANWAPLLKGVPDLTAAVARQTVEDGTEWGEWEQRGTVVDGSPHLVRGVVIFTVASELVQSARFYLEPVDEGEPA